MEDILMKLGAVLVGTVLGVVCNKAIRSRSEVRNTKVAEMEFLNKMILSESEHKITKTQRQEINHLKQEVYSSIIGVVVPLRTVDLLLTSKSPVEAMWAYKTYNKLLSHDEGESLIKYRRVGAIFEYVVLTFLLFVISLWMFFEGGKMLEGKEIQLIQVVFGIMYYVGGSILAILAGVSLNKVWDFLWSKRSVERHLREIVDIAPKIEKKE